MKTTPEELQDATRFSLLATLEHAEIVKFLQQYLKKFNPFIVGYYLANIMVVASIGYYAGKEAQAGKFTWDIFISCLSLGVLMTFVVGIIIHENIHLLAYKLVGARKATIQYQWRKMIFLAAADKFVANSREFYWVAILPFLLITSGLVIALFFVQGAIFYIVAGSLLMHTGACSGDFALMSFFYEHRLQNVLTYDDMEAGKTYFYATLPTDLA